MLGLTAARRLSIWALALLAVVLALPSAGWARPRPRDLALVDGRVVLTDRALRHIEARHWPDSPAPGAGKFAEGITPDALRALIDETTLKGRVRPNTHGRPGVTYECDFGRTLGIDIQGRPASRLRVVVSPEREVVTAFPF